ncbi:lysozyme-like [Battus philenor]|uniref:lysozyme-like n=1 Tax=Battus philenor TaxID=42288 RepID=UPI0035D0AF38
MKVFVIVFMLALFYHCECRKLSRCGLVRELRKNNFHESRIRDWVCLVEKSSRRQTGAVSKKHSDGSRRFGLFQISDEHWCSNSTKPGKECNVTCKQISSANVMKAARCAKKIHHREGFDAWSAWKDHCKGKPLPDISSCKK